MLDFSLYRNNSVTLSKCQKGVLCRRSSRWGAHDAPSGPPNLLGWKEGHPGCHWSRPFQSLRPGVQVSPWDGTGLLVYYVPPCIQTPWTPEPSLCESRTARLPTRYTVVVRCSSLRACWSISVEHSAVHLKNRNLTLTTFMRHLKSYLFSQYWFRIERVWGVIT